ncbi:MAG: hypothetical protein A2626_01820 [Candidatus Nealsonbacteria bacterium RIFCSPHIGHO2_01_FULL_38_55]|uniref:Uncharacterized protein n=1 Tax=Candidatus Nealsonbacteria bacterium RIFCSPHIGHO2_01_FULL_38_55 TaxID=1801664 RepID=A0A1G2E4Q9_9BACT|nr:MAG: hypothetical protein A2626_01820 [Candidatus Nealsonbacteria bacterium RIFCSPHIGHO2_01_FULL_38_55]OGZ21598.1 MAG: hypothetical protein A2W55_01270 [Candidatus Nealsonbacteria bacterium RIFCSPHIGHO2_02_38_10]OGZ22966.1 MAG: hypothetical protein A3E18_01770 [Candidatus Nealsonbacteria bacterium RIFCSPHIGHO2_12_FULL_38_18]
MIFYMKKIIFLFLFAFLFLIGAGFAYADSQSVVIDFFYSPTCPHCAREENFLKELEKTKPGIQINRFSVSESDNITALEKKYEEYEVLVDYRGMVPATFIESAAGKKYYVGFDENVEKNIENCIAEFLTGDNCQTGDGVTSVESSTQASSKGNINIPFIGSVNVDKYSLPILAVVLGALDGFNICSLGALVLILGLVLALRSRGKILFFGGVYILTTAIAYGLLIVLWYKIFSFFMPYMKLMEVLIGLLGLAGGIYFIKQFVKFRKQGPVCEVSASKGIMSKFSSKLQKYFQESRSVFLVALSTFLFAGIITIVEFPCSALVPVAFAGILAQAELSSFLYILYISLFVIFYMLDEVIVFLVALFTMKIWLASSKATAWVVLAESLILFAFAAYYLFGYFLFK